MEKIEQAPALGFSIAANLGTTKQLTLQCFFPTDIDVKEGHKLIDKAMAYADRQEAIALLPGLRVELEKLQNTLANFKRDLEFVSGDTDAKILAKQDQIKQLAATRQQVHVKDYTAFAESGRQGEYKASKGATADKARLEQAETQLKADIETLQSEREQNLSQLKGSIARFEADIAKHERWIAEKEALVSLE